ncbi:hypothetical protein PISMIDRAFT_676738 [Pisolithus microcarpus 441]|uniref:Uncharacterized protein n=1 Tax=Pisolithus microcarpus 441 TaxID=765257 RepID=A0A0C9YLD8_9AGAM|nr:hypothetical protein PISMIDRAFT_676738 [Pisolithus microcarpus 441]
MMYCNKLQRTESTLLFMTGIARYVVNVLNEVRPYKEVAYDVRTDPKMVEAYAARTRPV